MLTEISCTGFTNGLGNSRYSKNGVLLSKTGWLQAGTDDLGFSALPVNCYRKDAFDGEIIFWSTTDSWSSQSAYVGKASNSIYAISIGMTEYGYKSYACSVRCVQDVLTE